VASVFSNQTLQVGERIGDYRLVRFIGAGGMGEVYEAVRDDGKNSFVYVLQENRLRRRDVKLGISNLTRVEILNGIAQGDVIGVQSYSPSPMADGVEVKIVENPS